MVDEIIGRLKRRHPDPPARGMEPRRRRGRSSGEAAPASPGRRLRRIVKRVAASARRRDGF
ncbi:hypothetical protein J2S22_002402 [Rhodoplanes tepidamans]|nr:hypothetical protein [Rhodoplanes tepidamans]